VVRNVASSRSSSPPNAVPKSDTAATPALISSDTKCSSSTTSTRSKRAASASRASATISQAKFGAQKYVGNRSSARTAEPVTRIAATKPSSVIG
jgi:hypothetical protein